MPRAGSFIVCSQDCRPLCPHSVWHWAGGRGATGACQGLFLPHHQVERQEFSPTASQSRNGGSSSSSPGGNCKEACALFLSDPAHAAILQTNPQQHTVWRYLFGAHLQQQDTLPWLASWLESRGGGGGVCLLASHSPDP